MKNDFEYLINKLITKINKSGNNIGWKNNPARNHNGTYLKNGGEKFDYTVITEKGTFCFDAKITNDVYWHILAKDRTQGINLLSADLANELSHGFFIIYFMKINDYRTINAVKFWEIINKKDRMYIKVEECEKTRLEKMFFH